MTLAGLPTATLPAGTSRVTTAPAPITTRSPSSTPGRMMADAPIQQWRPMRMGRAGIHEAPCAMSWSAEITRMPGPKIVPSPISIPLPAWK